MVGSADLIIRLTAFDLRTLEHGYESGSSASKPVRSHHMTSQWNVIVSCEQSKGKKRLFVPILFLLGIRLKYELKKARKMFSLTEH